MILKAMAGLLLGNSGVTDKVQTRVYPYALPQGEEIPAIDMRSIGSPLEAQALVGIPNTRKSQVTLDCYGETPEEADDVAMAVLAFLPGYRGVVRGVTVLGIVTEGEIDNDVDGADPGSDKFRYVSSIDFEIVWSA